MPEQGPSDEINKSHWMIVIGSISVIIYLYIPSLIVGYMVSNK